ncbi:unnamed protein product [Moneuplotes crassus]|uniref:Uncharacterized protein n=1 Tax=Euplotes crassus TaxID=5936 RepID=A0AAD1XYY2_EUPCR|nr:unnamed protein product [Moneuplotes crassus]
MNYPSTTRNPVKYSQETTVNDPMAIMENPFSQEELSAMLYDDSDCNRSRQTVRENNHLKEADSKSLYNMSESGSDTVPENNHPVQDKNLNSLLFDTQGRFKPDLKNAPGSKNFIRGPDCMSYRTHNLPKQGIDHGQVVDRTEGLGIWKEVEFREAKAARNWPKGCATGVLHQHSLSQQHKLPNSTTPNKFLSPAEKRKILANSNSKENQDRSHKSPILTESEEVYKSQPKTRVFQKDVDLYCEENMDPNRNHDKGIYIVQRTKEFEKPQQAQEISIDSIEFTPKNRRNLHEGNCQRSGKELNELFSAKKQTTAKKHHRHISSISPLITETSKYRDEYDLSQEELIQNFISWKTNFETDVKEYSRTRKPFTNDIAQLSKLNEESLLIEDECQIDELPSFNLPRNLLISGTGKKSRFSKLPRAKNAFNYNERAKIIYGSQSASPSRSHADSSQKYSMMRTDTTIPIKISRTKTSKIGPSLKKQNLSVLKPVCLQPNNSDVWNETEYNSDSQSEVPETNRATPIFNKFREMTFGTREDPLSKRHQAINFEQMGKIKENIKKLRQQSMVFNLSASRSCERPSEQTTHRNAIFNLVFNIK